MAAKVSEYVFSSANKKHLRLVSESNLPRLSRKAFILFKARTLNIKLENSDFGLKCV